MAMLESDVLTRASDLLNDTSNTYWPVAELRRWLNDGQRVIATLRPDSTSETLTYGLTAGVLQTLPVGAQLLLDIPYNSNGRSIRICEMETLAAYNPNWAGAAQAQIVENFMYDERTPLVFYVYPPAAANSVVTIVFSKNPQATTGPNDPIVVNDSYVDVLVDYIVYRAQSKDAEIGALNESSKMHYQFFHDKFRTKIESDIRLSPNTANKGGETPKAIK